jgi:hypothetical protein
MPRSDQQLQAWVRGQQFFEGIQHQFFFSEHRAGGNP